MCVLFPRPSASDSLSVSVESLDADYNIELVDLDDEDDVDLLPSEHEPEAWSVTVDKKTLKRMSAKNIKRQDHIWGKASRFIPFGVVYFLGGQSILLGVMSPQPPNNPRDHQKRLQFPQ